MSLTAPAAISTSKYDEPKYRLRAAMTLCAWMQSWGAPARRLEVGSWADVVVSGPDGKELPVTIGRPAPADGISVSAVELLGEVDRGFGLCGLALAEVWRKLGHLDPPPFPNRPAAPPRVTYEEDPLAIEFRHRDFARSPNLSAAALAVVEPVLKRAAKRIYSSRRKQLAGAGHDEQDFEQLGRIYSLPFLTRYAENQGKDDRDRAYLFRYVLQRFGEVADRLAKRGVQDFHEYARFLEATRNEGAEDDSPRRRHAEIERVLANTAGSGAAKILEAVVLDPLTPEGARRKARRELAARQSVRPAFARGGRVEVPQANDLGKIRDYLSPAPAAETERERRNALYYGTAADLLGLAGPTALGQELLTAEAGSAAERAVLRRAVESSESLAPFRALLLASVESAPKDFVTVAVSAGASVSTAERRACALRAWWRFLNK